MEEGEEAKQGGGREERPGYTLTFRVQEKKSLARISFFLLFLLFFRGQSHGTWPVDGVESQCAARIWSLRSNSSTSSLSQ